MFEKICLVIKHSLLTAVQKDVSKSAVTATEFTVEDQHLIKCL